MKNYLSSLRWPFILSLSLFLALAFAGYYLGGTLSSILPELEKIYGGLKGLNTVELAIFIFANNSWKSLLAILLGPFLAIFPVLFATSNGLVLGLVGFSVVGSRGLTFFLAGILPHGIIEIPAVLLSSAIGIRIGHETIRGKGIREELGKGLKFFALRIVPLLLLAAMVEVFLTPLILNLAK